MICSIWSGHVDPEAWTFSAFGLLNSCLVGSSPIRWDESYDVLRNVCCTARFPSLPFLFHNQVLCGLPHLLRTRWSQALVSVFLTEIFELCPGLSCKLLLTAVFRGRLVFCLLCRWLAYCREPLGISFQQANTFYVVLGPSLFCLF